MRHPHRRPARRSVPAWTSTNSAARSTDDADLVWDDARGCRSCTTCIYTLPKPTIAAVNGAAVAGGAGLVTVCDLAVAVPTAKFGYPEVRRGLVAAMVMPHLLRHVGERAARWLLLTGELIDAAEAQRVGLVNAVVEPARVDGRRPAPGPEAWPRAGRRRWRRRRSCCSGSRTRRCRCEELAKASAEPRLTDECQHGLAAFFDKRPAPWVPPADQK